MFDILHDGSFDIALGKHRNETNWKNREMLWSDLLGRVSETHRTTETLAEYMAAKPERQDEIKDIGGFVGGYIAGGRRLKHSILHRQIIALDIDHTKENVWELFTMLYGNTAAMYSTHKHSPESPRLRLLIPLKTKVEPAQYEAIARRIAGEMDIEIFDITTFQPSRLMYWPSTAKDAEFFFEYQDGPWMDPEAILNTYHDWQDSSQWPVSVRVNKVVDRLAKKQGDPLEKPGIVGAFCRTFPVSAAIKTFLSDRYTECDIENRYTYIEGTTSAGLVIYEDDKFAFSHHGTDPISGKLCNAFDLVRLHLFGVKDEDAADGTPGNRMPSYTAMVALAQKDKGVRMLLGSERTESAQSDFAEIDFDNPELELQDDNKEWLAGMKIDRNGAYYTTIANILMILENDPVFKGRIAFDDFEKCEVALKPMPWWKAKLTHQNRRLTDYDDSSIRHYLEDVYGITGTAKIDDALLIYMRKHSFHPVRDYLAAVRWDGEKRLETLIIDYLGAADTPYTRTVTRKAFCAAVARIYQPGCKFDHAFTFVGAEGSGKSTLIDKMGQLWYSDNFSTVQGKESIEQIQGAWLVEMAELAALKRADRETTKHYISRREDRYRVAYGKRVEFFPRQCVFFGSTEKKDFLQLGYGGDRRWWPVEIGIQDTVKSVFTDLTQDIVDQLWAEAVEYYRTGETRFLNKEMEAEAKIVQAAHRENDDRAGLIQKYLETLLPDNWDDMDTWERRSYLKPADELEPVKSGTVRRDKVCAAEIYVEVLGGMHKDMSAHNTKFIHDIMRVMPGWAEYKSRTLFKDYGNQKAYFRVKSPLGEGMRNG